MKKPSKSEMLREDNNSLRKDLRMYKSLFEQVKNENKELISLNLWSARRLHKVHKQFAYDELDRVTNSEWERV